MSIVRRPPCPSRPRQSGVAAMLILFVIAVVAISFLVNALKSSSSQTERDKITAVSLAQAKAALIGFAASVDLSGCASTTDCARPGDLPCPDRHPSGSLLAGVSSTPCPAPALGRLPWRTLGLPDLRDGYGERLWYAVSNSFKNNTRALPLVPLNSDTQGTISVRGPNGTTIANAAAGAGMAAVVISPGAAFTRQDGIVQDRSQAGYNNPINYLDVDVSSGEDNRDYINGSLNGFIQGPIKTTSNSIILNDTLITISRDDIMRVVEKRVASEVRGALADYFAAYKYYPRPAKFSDGSCLGNADLTPCGSDTSLNRGRIPANPASASWDIASILRGSVSKNWFQQNGWREVIYYAVAPACTKDTPNCSGSGFLTVNAQPFPPLISQQVVLIATGRALTYQDHGSSTNLAPKALESNYLEDENLTPLYDTYSLRPLSAATPFNDKLRCLPASPPQC